MRLNKQKGFKLIDIKWNKLNLNRREVEYLRKLIELGTICGWEFGYYNESSKGIVFYNSKKSGCTMIVYLSNQDVITKLYHPKFKRRSALRRPNVDINKLYHIFHNPRVHLNKGKHI